jgi:hypothetical protein
VFGRDSWDSWKSYTPTFTAGVGGLGNGTAVGMWRRMGDSIEVLIEVVMGTTTTFEVGQPLRASLPNGYERANGKILSNSSRVYGSGYYLDNSAHSADRSGMTQINNSDTRIFGITESFGGFVIDNQPFAWSNSDRLIWWGTIPVEGF